MPVSLTDRPAASLVQLIAAGEVSSREVLEAHIEQVERVDPAINAVVWRMFDSARVAAARADDAVARGDDLGPLHGLPVSIKDQFLVEGTPTTYGLPSRAGHRASAEGPLLHRLRGAGAIPFVKTNVPVMLVETETHNPLYGRTSNPYASDRTSGGSSGGEAALLAARGSPLGLGADIGGSLRVPAHYCGIVTLKSTAHRLPAGDTPPELPTWQEAIVDVKGPMARTVADVTLAFRVLATGADPLPPEPLVPPVAWRSPDDVEVRGLHVGVVEHDGGVESAPAVRRAVRTAADALAAAGARVEPFRGPAADEVFDLYTHLFGGDGFRLLREAIGDDPLSPVTRLLTATGRLPAPVLRALSRVVGALGQPSAARTVAGGGWLTTRAYSRHLVHRQALLGRLARSFAAGPDVLLYPPHALPALPHGRFRDVVYASTTTFFPNVVGLPAGVVPVTTVRPDEERAPRSRLDVVSRLLAAAERGSAGLPVGVQVIAPWWREDVVLATMAAIERGVGGVPPPPITRPSVPRRSRGGGTPA